MKAFALLVFIGLGNALQAQSWERVHTLQQAPPQNGPGGDFRFRVALSGDLLAFSDPSWSAWGRVRLFQANGGGAGTWELIGEVEGAWAEGNTPWGGFGRTLAFVGEDLFVGGSFGSWRYGASSTGLGALERLANDQARGMASSSDRLVISGPLVLNLPTGVLKQFVRNDQDDFVVNGLVGIPPHSILQEGTCPGSAIAFEFPYIVVGDSCWTTNDQVPESGILKTFVWDPVANNYSADASGDYGGYWPYGEGVTGMRHFGRSLALNGDTLFVGLEAIDATPHVEVFVKGSPGWVRHSQILAPEGLEQMANMGLALEANGPDVFIGTDHGLAFYRQESEGWSFEGFDDLGGPATAIVADGERVAVAVPSLGRIHVYERSPTSVRELNGPSVPLMSCSPNPASSLVMIRVTAEVPARSTLLVTDLLGRKLHSAPWPHQMEVQLERGANWPSVTLIRAVASDGRTLAVQPVVWTNE